LKKNGTVKEILKDFHRETSGFTGVVIFVNGSFMWLGNGVEHKIVTTMDSSTLKIKKYRDIDVGNAQELITFDSKKAYIVGFKNGLYHEIDLENEKISDPVTSVSIMNFRNICTQFGEKKILYKVNENALNINISAEFYIYYYNFDSTPKKITKQKNAKTIEKVFWMFCPNLLNQ